MDNSNWMKVAGIFLAVVQVVVKVHVPLNQHTMNIIKDIVASIAEL